MGIEMQRGLATGLLVFGITGLGFGGVEALMHASEKDLFGLHASTARALLAQELVDADSLQLKDVRSRDGRICGLFRSNSQIGGYMGFSVFGIPKDRNRVVMLSVDSVYGSPAMSEADKFQNIARQTASIREYVATCKDIVD